MAKVCKKIHFEREAPAGNSEIGYYSGGVLYWKADILEVSVKRKCYVGYPEIRCS